MRGAGSRISLESGVGESRGSERPHAKACGYDDDYNRGGVRALGVERWMLSIECSGSGPGPRTCRFAWICAAWCFVVAMLLPELASAAPPSGVGFEQRIGEKLPLALTFTDTAGHRRQLAEFFDHQPVVLYFGYARCPQLCSVVADSTVEALRRLERSVGRDLQVVTISLDSAEPRREARATEKLAIGRYGRTGAAAGWHYLTGDGSAIDAIARAAGFHYRLDPSTHEYAHPSGFLVATPDGVISRYFLGIDFNPQDVAAALNRAADGGTGRSVYDLLLLCFHGDAIGGRYGTLIWRALEVGVTLTVIALFGGIGWMLHLERRALTTRKETR